MALKKYGKFGDQNRNLYSGQVLLARTTPLANNYNPYTGLLNPQLSSGTTSILFESIPQNFKDLKLIFRNTGHTTANTTGYRIRININQDSTNTRYYTRAGVQVSGGNTSGANWNSDNTDGIYWGYIYNPTLTSWAPSGEMIIPNYSATMPANFRAGYGMWWHMNQMSYPQPCGFQYYNNSAAALPVTSLLIRIESNHGFHANSEIALYGIE
jgi:hypothetical protein